MNLFTRLAPVILLAMGAGPVSAAPPADLAELFPSGTLAYAELHNPAELAPQLAAVFRGTALEDSIPFIHGRKDAAKTLVELQGKQHLALVGLFTSPEMLAEFKKLHIAGGLVGFTETGDPDAALVVLTHDSPAAGLAARAYLTMTSQLRKVGEVSKVPVFQFRTPNINYDNNGVPQIQNNKLSDGPHELTLAYTPGLFVIGTSKTAVGHTIKRFLGEEKAEGLASTAAFKEEAKTYRQTGLFYFVNYPEFVAKHDAANKTRGNGGNDALRRLVNFGELDAFEWFKMTANPKAVKAVAGCVRFRDGGISATASLSFDPAQKSPLLEFLSGSGVNVELLHHARHPATLACSVTLPEKNRTAALVGFLDAMAKANGELGRLPGDVVRELSDKYKLPVADGLVGKLRAVTIMMPTKQELPKGGKPGPLLVLHTDDAAAATAWEEFLPKLIGDLAGAASAPQPSTETIDGVKVFTVSGTGLRWNAPVHFARNGTAVSIGLDRKLVAAATRADAAASVIGGERAVSPPGEPVAMLGVLALGEIIAPLIEKPQAKGPVVPVEDGTASTLLLPNGNPVPESMIEELKKARKEFFASLGTIAPARLTVRRTGNELRFEVFQPKVQQGALKSAIDAAANWLDRTGGLSSDGNTPYGGRFYK